MPLLACTYYKNSHVWLVWADYLCLCHRERERELIRRFLAAGAAAGDALFVNTHIILIRELTRSHESHRCY